jgi:hypothetical protein
MVTLITFAFCEKEGVLGVTGLEMGGVSIVDGVSGINDTGEFSTVLDDDVCGLDGTGDDDEVASLNLLTLSLCVRSNGRSSKIKIYRY